MHIFKKNTHNMKFSDKYMQDIMHVLNNMKNKYKQS